MVKVTETLLDGDPARYEQRYSLYIGSRLFGRFVRRPISIEPSGNFVGFVDNGPRYGTIPRNTAGAFKDGKWVRIGKLEPTHWTVHETD